MEKSKGSYWAFLLDEASRQKLLAMFPPKFDTVYAHHVTYMFGVPESAIPQSNAGATFAITPVSYVHDDSLEAVVVRVEGHGVTRPDGKTFHVTLSLASQFGRKPKESNDVIAAGKNMAVIPNPVRLWGTLTYL